MHGTERASVVGQEIWHEEPVSPLPDDLNLTLNLKG